MSGFAEKDYKIFEMFEKDWALATAGTLEHFNSCTIARGMLGTTWVKPGNGGEVATIFLYPTRHTLEFVQQSDQFTISFFPKSYKKMLGYMGTHSGRDGDKAAACGLTPVAMGESVTYEEANLTFLCKKLYQHQISKEDLAPEIKEFYEVQPGIFPRDESGDWQTHWIFVGRIIAVDDRR